MASGSISLTSTKAWSGLLSWSSTADTAGNYSDISVYATMWKTDGYLTSSNSYTYGTVTIDGTDYALTGYQEFKDTVCIFSDTVRIYHDSDGTKSISISLTCYGQASTSLSGYTLSGSGTAVLDTIARSASLSVSAGTLGTAQTITIISDSSSLTYTVTYSCGSYSGTICTKSSSKSISWTPPLTLANVNTTGTSVTVKLSLTTYSGSTSVGTDSASIQCAIPASVKPSFTAAFTDAVGYKDTYGTYIQHLSQLKTVVTASSVYGATIKAYKITANGETFTTAESTTGVLTTSGSITVQITVTDTRGRTAQSDFTITVTAYTQPYVSSLSVHRCDSGGTENDQGAYVQVTFSAGADSFDSENTVAYKLEYKKTTATAYTAVTLSAYANVFSISGKTYIFAADTGSSYDVRLTVTDAFTSTSKSTTASTAATIMHFKANGKGLGLGKVAEVDNAVDVGWKVNMNSLPIKNLSDPEDDADAATKKYVDALNEVISAMTKTIYPVGAIYISTSSTSPASLFGGTWTSISGRFLLASSSSYTAGKTGGSATHTLTISEMPKHNHWGVYRPSWYLHTETGQASGVSDGASNNQLFTDYEGGGGAHNNIPPYLVVYMWKRTA